MAPRGISTDQLGRARRGSAFDAPEPRAICRRVAAVPGAPRALRRGAPAHAKVRVVLGRVRLSPRRSASRHRVRSPGRCTPAEGRLGRARRSVQGDASDRRTARLRSWATVRFRAESRCAVRGSTRRGQRRSGRDRPRHDPLVCVARARRGGARTRPHARRDAEEVLFGHRRRRGADRLRARCQRDDTQPSARSRGRISV